MGKGYRIDYTPWERMGRSFRRWVFPIIFWIVVVGAGIGLLGWGIYGLMVWECSNYEDIYEDTEVRMPAGCFVYADGRWWHIKQVDREFNRGE